MGGAERSMVVQTLVAGWIITVHDGQRAVRVFDVGFPDQEAAIAAVSELLGSNYSFQAIAKLPAGTDLRTGEILER